METEKMIEILRRVRHDFANHIQVISGLEQMGMHERVQTYLAGVVEEMVHERVLFASLESESALYLYAQLLKIRDLGIIMRYEDLEFSSLEIMKNKNEPMASMAVLQTEVQTSTDDETIVYVSIYEDSGGIDLLISCDSLPQETRTVRVNRE
ncbi:MAG: Spo0B domain-containing protein [Bacillota bacterium]|nr:Spo0B domain-containing protein [Bacillota bacterium]